jgi:hypothetical protein
LHGYSQARRGGGLKKKRKCFGLGIFLLFISILFGCAFDLAHIKSDPVRLDSGVTEQRSFKLKEDVALNSIACGYKRTLKKDKKWTLIGRIEEGDVFKPIDHCFTIECSNVYEAYLVIQEDQLDGFYLPVEKGFVKMGKPVKLPMNPIE